MTNNDAVRMLVDGLRLGFETASTELNVLKTSDIEQNNVLVARLERRVTKDYPNRYQRCLNYLDKLAKAA